MPLNCAVGMDERAQLSQTTKQASNSQFQSSTWNYVRKMPEWLLNTLPHSINPHLSLHPHGAPKGVAHRLHLVEANEVTEPQIFESA